MESTYEVVSPVGDARDAAGPERRTVGAPPLASLPGKKIGLVWTEFYNGDTVLRAFQKHLSERYPDLQFVEMAPGRNRSWGDHPDVTIGELAREHEINGAVVAAGC